MSDPVAVVRRFNRSYTQRIGVLDDSFLGLGMPLGPARLLFEIGAAPATTRRLRDRLGLDSGYLSRLLRRLEEEGLVDVSTDPGDRRRRLVRLTEAGQDRWTELERRSHDQARLIVDPLTERQRERLARALSEADLLVRAATVRFEPVGPAHGQGRGRQVLRGDRPPLRLRPVGRDGEGRAAARTADGRLRRGALRRR